MSDKPNVRTEFIASWNDWQGEICVAYHDYSELERERDALASLNESAERECNDLRIRFNQAYEHGFSNAMELAAQVCEGLPQKHYIQRSDRRSRMAALCAEEIRKQAQALKKPSQR